MEILIGFFVASYLIGRIVLLENNIYKKNEGTLRFTSGNLFKFAIICCVKIFIAFEIISIFIPDETVRNLKYASTSANPVISKAVYQIETRLLIAFLGVAIGDFVGIFKLKN